MNGYTIENKTAGSYSGIDDAGDECIVFLVKGEGAHLTLNATNGGSVRATGDGVKSNFNVAVWVADGASLVGSGEVILLKNGCSWSEIDKDGYYSVVSAN